MKDSGALLVFTVGGLPCPPCPGLWAPGGHPCMAPCFPMLCSLSASTLSLHRGQGRRRMGPQLFSKIRPLALCWVPPSDPCFHICAGKCPVSWVLGQDGEGQGHAGMGLSCCFLKTLWGGHLSRCPRSCRFWVEGLLGAEFLPGFVLCRHGLELFSSSGETPLVCFCLVSQIFLVPSLVLAFCPVRSLCEALRRGEGRCWKYL